MPPNPTSPPIHIHALWRTGSTYTWNAFKMASDHLRCYFEPFHHSLIKSRNELIRDFEIASDKFDLAFMKDNYYRNYGTTKNGVPQYQWQFSVDDYVLMPEDEHPAILSYLQRLTELANDNNQRPVMQFNRAPFRAKWLKKHFQSTDIYITRNPIDMMKSYQKLSSNRLNYYMSCYLGIIQRYSNHPLFQEMAEYLNLKRLEADSFMHHLRSHSAPTFNALPEGKANEILVFFWTLSLLNATQYAEFTLDMELADQENSPNIAAQFQDNIRSITSINVDFSDLHPQKYSDFRVIPISSEAATIIQRAVQLIDPDWRQFENMPLAGNTRKQVEHSLNTLPHVGKVFSGIGTEPF